MYKQALTLMTLAAGMASAFAAVPSAIVLDGYCDYFTELTTEGDTGAAGHWMNVDCQGADSLLGGMQASSLKGKISYVFGTTGYAATHSSHHEVTWWIRDDETWTVFDWQGVVLNSGTWSKIDIAPLKSGGAKPATR